jgi:hypothetical protein
MTTTLAQAKDWFNFYFLSNSKQTNATICCNLTFSCSTGASTSPPKASTSKRSPLTSRNNTTLLSSSTCTTVEEVDDNTDTHHTLNIHYLFDRNKQRERKAWQTKTKLILKEELALLGCSMSAFETLQKSQLGKLGGKPILVVDLDLTLIDSSVRPRIPMTKTLTTTTFSKSKQQLPGNLNNVNDDQLVDEEQPQRKGSCCCCNLTTSSPLSRGYKGVHIVKVGSSYRFVKLRPGALSFVRAASKMFELHLYTHSTREVTDAVLSVVFGEEARLFTSVITRCDTDGDTSKKRLCFLNLTKQQQKQQKQQKQKQKQGESSMDNGNGNINDCEKEEAEIDLDFNFFGGRSVTIVDDNIRVWMEELKTFREKELKHQRAKNGNNNNNSATHNTNNSVFSSLIMMPIKPYRYFYRSSSPTVGRAKPRLAVQTKLSPSAIKELLAVAQQAETHRQQQQQQQEKIELKTKPEDDGNSSEILKQQQQQQPQPQQHRHYEKLEIEDECVNDDENANDVVLKGEKQEKENEGEIDFEEEQEEDTELERIYSLLVRRYLNVLLTSVSQNNCSVVENNFGTEKKTTNTTTITNTKTTITTITTTTISTKQKEKDKNNKTKKNKQKNDNNNNNSTIHNNENNNNNNHTDADFKMDGDCDSNDSEGAGPAVSSGTTMNININKNMNNKANVNMQIINNKCNSTQRRGSRDGDVEDSNR